MMWLRCCLVAGAVLALSACDDDDPVAPEDGTIEVTVTTSGEGTDEDGFTVSLDDEAETEAIEVDGSVTFEDVVAGNHTVELTDLSSNCTVDGDNPESVTLAAGGEETVEFSVTCTASS